MSKKHALSGEHDVQKGQKSPDSIYGLQPVAWHADESKEPMCDKGNDNSLE